MSKPNVYANMAIACVCICSNNHAGMTFLFISYVLILSIFKKIKINQLYVTMQLAYNFAASQYERHRDEPRMCIPWPYSHVHFPFLMSIPSTPVTTYRFCGRSLIKPECPSHCICIRLGYLSIYNKVNTRCVWIELMLVNANRGGV